MKSILFVLSLIWVFSSVATELPTNVCSEIACTSKMKEINDLFALGSANISTDDLTAYSGSCFHNNNLYDPEHEHHGVFIFQKKAPDTLTTGLFSFFAESDPFEKMPTSELTSYVLHNGGRFAKTKEVENSLYLEFLTSETFTGYWFRRVQNDVIVIGKDAGSSYINHVFCHLTKR